ncbi:hypothetical protein [Adhaeribacter soli]|uniref:Uncharacterized protein n=1 Tax=Adhaeribacter soli TaxID=2607655 RepID=A0A5N1J2V3_9BACT|nr:hypothetical protein [Adhaeribacter soli]KAA9338962.1 hypothetical protein F0P94_09230 [Adhaeribacter soli]
MAIYIYPKKISLQDLLSRIYASINSDKTLTWEINNGRIIHTADSEQWNEGGYLYQAEQNNPTCLVFYYQILEGKSPRPDTYGVYNGRFVQMLLNKLTQEIERFEVKDLRNKS